MPQDNDQINVPFVVYESAQTRMERANKRLAVALVLTIVLLFLSNLAWLWAWMQYDYVVEAESTSIDVGAKDGIANYIGNDGDINNGIHQSEENPNTGEQD